MASEEIDGPGLGTENPKDLLTSSPVYSST